MATLTHRIEFRATAEDVALFTEEARRRRLSLGAWIRMSLAESLEPAAVWPVDEDATE